MSNQTLFIGQVFLEYPSLASTNTTALEYLAEHKPSEGTVIATPRQTAGRGQIGNKWESEPYKNISLSIILYPKFLPIMSQFELSKIIGLAVVDCLKAHCNKKIAMKWPNDIYIGDKKIAGILIQNALSGSLIKHSVAGIGININQEIFITNPPNPTSLKLETGNDFDLQELSKALCWHVENWYLKLKSGKYEAIHQAYLNNLYRFGEWHSFQSTSTLESEVFQGKITGIAKNGQLIIKTETDIHSFNIKEVKFL